MTNYIAGMPFPMVSTTDPKAAIKIAYNWHMGPFMPDDFSLEPWGSFAYSGTEPGSFVAEDWNAYKCSRLVFLRFAHRTEVDPRPTLGTNEDGIEWELRFLEWQGGPDMSPGIGRVTGAVVRYLDPKKADGAIWAGGRTTKYSPRQGFPEVSDEKCRGCHQPRWAYALPKTEEYTYRLLGTALMLACVTANHEPAGIVRREKDMTFSEEPFQLRNAYILEMTPKRNVKLRTVVYIDTEAFVWLGAEFFAGNEKTEAAFPFWRSSPSPSGGYVFELAGEFYVPFDHSPSLLSIRPTAKPFFFVGGTGASSRLIPARCQVEDLSGNIRSSGNTSGELFSLARAVVLCARRFPDSQTPAIRNEPWIVTPIFSIRGRSIQYIDSW